jgi:hypothetical protein
MNNLIETFGEEKRWVNWKPLTREGKVTKIPFQVSGEKASSTNPDTWSTYAEVKAKSDNVGIVFTSDQKLLGIDIDHCIENGVIVHSEANKIRVLIQTANTYTELSPSKTGLHLMLAVTESLSLVANKHAPFECYTIGRYFTVTSEVFEQEKDIRTISSEEALGILGLMGYPWSKLPPMIDTSLPSTELLQDEELLEKMFVAKNGVAIKTLYDGDLSAHNNDESSADLALCLHLAFWTRKNATQMERIWLASPLGSRDKTRKRKDYRRLTIDAAITKCTEVYSPEKKKPVSAYRKPEPQTDTLLEIIDNQESLVLFHDEHDRAYVTLEVLGHQEIWECKSKSTRRWLTNEFWKKIGRAPTSEALKNVIGVLEGRASFDGPMYRLGNRFTWNNGELWYDLTNEKWQAVKITEESWEVIDESPILFRRYKHHQEQVLPSRNGDAKLFLKYVNIEDPQQQLLLMVYLICCFIPDFPHVILMVFGSQGSAKTTLSKLLRQVNDPSLIDVGSMPDNLKELIQKIAHHAFLIFDNVSYLSADISDTLCKSVTGTGFVKRELYSDDEDVIYNLKRSIGINGINLTGVRPDLLERSLFLELDRIEPANRRPEEEIIKSFRKDLPAILGGVFDILVKALHIKPTIKITDLPRMADFAIWGSAVAEAAGYTQESFLEAYRKNMSMQTDIILNENNVATAILSFMEDKSGWKGTPTRLLHELTHFYGEEGIELKYDKYWPKSAAALTRKMNELKVTLQDAGISFLVMPGKEREIILKKAEISETDDIDDVSPDSAPP